MILRIKGGRESGGVFMFSRMDVFSFFFFCLFSNSVLV